MSKVFDLLLETDKKKIFQMKSQVLMGYSSGLMPLDYISGYFVKVQDKKKKGKNQVDSWANIGLRGGEFITVVGNTNVGKTSLCVKIGSSMVRPFELGDFIHNDGEHTSNYTRIQQLNGWSDDEIENKYHIEDIVYVEDLFTMIYNLAMVKMSSKEFLYHTGKPNEFGEEIIIPQPTAVLIDSLPSLQTMDVEGDNELGSNTYNMRLAIAYNTFYKRLRPMINKANITVMAVNHLKEKPQMGFVKTQAKVQLLAPNESIPGGTGPLYYSQTLLKLKYKEQYTMEKHGFDGYLAEVKFLKSKTNRSGSTVELVYDYKTGFDEWLTLLHYAQQIAVIKGRAPYAYFESTPEEKFSPREFREAIKKPELRNAMLKDIAPSLMDSVSKGLVNPSDFSPEQLVHSINANWD